MPVISNSPRQRAGYKIVYHLDLDGGGWTRRVELDDGSQVVCVLTRGRRVRVAFKPRNFVGFKWYASVMVGGKTLWSDECVKGLGVAGMLEAAGLIDRGRCGRMTYRSSPGATRALRSTETLASYCRNIIPKSWKGQWCESCTETIAHQARYFYNESGTHFWEERLSDWARQHHYVRFYDDALGRWADDGGLSP